MSFFFAKMTNFLVIRRIKFDKGEDAILWRFWLVLITQVRSLFIWRFFFCIAYRFEDEGSSPGLRSPKFVPSPENISFRGWWTYPYYSCGQRRWVLSYSVAIPPIGKHGYVCSIECSCSLNENVLLLSSL